MAGHGSDNEWLEDMLERVGLDDALDEMIGEGADAGSPFARKDGMPSLAYTSDDIARSIKERLDLLGGLGPGEMIGALSRMHAAYMFCCPDIAYYALYPPQIVSDDDDVWDGELFEKGTFIVSDLARALEGGTSFPERLRPAPGEARDDVGLKGLYESLPREEANHRVSSAVAEIVYDEISDRAYHEAQKALALSQRYSVELVRGKCAEALAARIERDRTGALNKEEMPF